MPSIRRHCFFTFVFAVALFAPVKMSAGCPHELGGVAGDPATAFDTLPSELRDLKRAFDDPSLQLRVYGPLSEAKDLLRRAERRLPRRMANRWTSIGVCGLLTVGMSATMVAISLCSAAGDPSDLLERSIFTVTTALSGGLFLLYEFNWNRTPYRSSGEPTSRQAIAREIDEHRAIWDRRAPGGRLTTWTLGRFSPPASRRKLHLLTYLGTDSLPRTVVGYEVP